MSLTMKSSPVSIPPVPVIADQYEYWISYAPTGFKWAFGNAFGLNAPVGSGEYVRTVLCAGTATANSNDAGTYIAFPVAFRTPPGLIVTQLDNSAGGNWNTVRPSLGPCPFFAGHASSDASGFTFRTGVTIPYDGQTLIDFTGINIMWIAWGY